MWSEKGFALLSSGLKVSRTPRLGRFTSSDAAPGGGHLGIPTPLVLPARGSQPLCLHSHGWQRLYLDAGPSHRTHLAVSSPHAGGQEKLKEPESNSPCSLKNGSSW